MAQLHAGVMAAMDLAQDFVSRLFLYSDFFEDFC